MSYVFGGTTVTTVRATPTRWRPDVAQREKLLANMLE